ncbi:hypothetical protein LQV63_11205 [Paenibacillus profundus]|uniref:Uncharacterized protein n=2 Tax=Paenibacillus TaxID=44249 RepID=A0ABS8YCY9_9BACL|nr:hypothetical protein [Paenibacillus sp. OSY-SE]MCE5169880.1 hypothetical protein [Paenibacillus profundus]MCM3342169.1 hypothetical protein [Paenibacillus sp. MER TA 81-3]
MTLVDQDFVIEQVQEKFNCTVLKCEGRPVLEYGTDAELDQIGEYVRAEFDKELLDVFFAAIESVKPE